LTHTLPKSGNVVVKVKVGPLAAFMVNNCVFDTAAAPVVVTPTVALPAVAISVAGIVAFNCVALTKVVVLLVPFQVTVELLLTKLVPFTVIVKPGSPALANVGEIDVVVGVDTGVTKAHVVSYTYSI